MLIIASDLSGGGGVNRVVANLTHMLSSLSCVSVSVFNNSTRKNIYYPVAEDTRIVRARTFLPKARYLNLIMNLLFLRCKNFDCVISAWTHENIAVFWAFRGAATKIVLCEHCSHDFLPIALRRIRDNVYKKVRFLLVLNTEELRYYSQHNSQTMLMPNPAVSKVFAAGDAFQKEKLIIGVGHLVPRKGFMDFVAACVSARIDLLGWRALIVGDGPDRQALEAAITNYRAGSFIELRSSTPDIARFYRMARIIIAPSRSEVFSMVIVEAMAHGVVPLAYAADGPRDILRRWPDCLVPIGDTRGLIVALRRAILDPNLEERAFEMREEVLRLYSFESVSQRWKTLLSS